MILRRSSLEPDFARTSRHFFCIAISFAILTGIVEACGLLIFQRINWADWGPMLHVSEEILWISPLVDLAFFLLLALIAALIRRITGSIPADPDFASFLAFLAVYDWLRVSARLYQISC